MNISVKKNIKQYDSEILTHITTLTMKDNAGKAGVHYWSREFPSIHLPQSQSGSLLTTQFLLLVFKINFGTWLCDWLIYIKASIVQYIIQHLYRIQKSGEKHWFIVYKILFYIVRKYLDKNGLLWLR